MTKTRPAKKDVDEFLRQKNIAVAGVSRNPQKFGSAAFRTLKECGYSVYAVNPNVTFINGDRVYSTLHDIPHAIDGVVVVVPPTQTEKIVEEASALGIRRIWLQQGSESQAAIDFCRAHDMSVVSGECILMFAEPAGFPHRLHRSVKRIFGGLPK